MRDKNSAQLWLMVMLAVEPGASQAQTERSGALQAVPCQDSRELFPLTVQPKYSLESHGLPHRHKLNCHFSCSVSQAPHCLTGSFGVCNLDAFVASCHPSPGVRRLGFISKRILASVSQ